MNTASDVASAIKALAKDKKITIKKMLSECDLSVNTLSSMQSGGYYPRVEALFRIADYLNCSVDYLLGRTDNPESHLSSASPKEVAPSPTQMLLDTFNQLSEGDQFILIGEAKNLLNTWNERSVAADREALGKPSPSSGTGGDKGHAEEKPA